MLDPVPAPEPTCLSRRVILAAVGAGLVVLAGCSSDSSSGQPADTGPGNGGPVDTPTGVPSSATRRMLISTTAVPVGGGTVVAGLLVVQPTPGRFTAFDVRCPHRGAPVSPPQAGVITCFEHGSTFRDVDGSLLGGPAPRGLKQVPIVVENDTISVV